MIRLEARNLSIRRGEDLLVSGLSFSLDSGEALVVTGPNGSGKSTLLRAIAGLIPIEAGNVVLAVAGQPLARPAEACHYLGHLNAMKREMTVRENLTFWKSMMGDFDGGTGISPDAAAEMLGLGDITHLPFGYLSAGQQRRMAMARLLVAHRPLWLLDEPTAAMDGQSEALVAELVESHLAKGGIAIAATHQPLALGNVKTLVMTGFANQSDIRFQLDSE